MSSLGRIVTIILAIILVLFLPIQYIAQSQVEAMDHIVEAHTHEFADNIRQKGNITLEDYEEYLYKIDQTKELYKIEIEHARPKTLSDLTLNICDDTRLASNGLTIVSDTSKINSMDAEIKSYATHSHTDACYGHPNSALKFTGSTNGKGYVNIVCEECNNIVGKVTRGYVTRSDNGNIHTESYHTYFIRQNISTKVWELVSVGATKEYGVDAYSGDKEYKNKEAREKLRRDSTTPDNVVYIYYNYRNLQGITYNDLMNEYSGFSGIVGKAHDRGKYYDTVPTSCPFKEEGGNPKCDQVVTSIAATNPIQTINKGGAIITTATATFLDGHTEIVNCVSNYNPNIDGTQTVTLTYSGLVDNARTYGTKTCTVKVTVIDKKVSKIVVTPASQTIERYKNPVFIVRVYYDDGSSNIRSTYKTTGFNNKILGKQTVTFTYTENDISKTTTSEVTVTNLSKVCPICSTRYELDDNDTDNGCPNCVSTITGIDASPELVTVSQGSALPITVYAFYKNGGSSIINNWTSNYDPLKTGYQQVTINYKGFKDYITVEVKASKNICSICGKEYSLNEDGSDPGCPICSTTLIGIKAEPDKVIIDMHQPLGIKVTATFKDGHRELVDGWTADMVPDKPGTYKVTIFYKSAADQITVTIRDYDLTECAYCGRIFSRSKNPSGCPICSAELIGIEASLRNGGSTVIKGSKPDLEIILIFRDTHREVTYSGYTISNYQPDQLGEQAIEVHYKEFKYNLIIEVIDTFGKTTCPKGHVYQLNEDGSDSGCPYCIDYGDREKLLVYYDITYTTKIVETLYNQNIYNMKAGDYITIIVTKKNRSLRAQIINIFTYNKEINNTISYGGEVIG